MERGIPPKHIKNMFLGSGTSPPSGNDASGHPPTLHYYHLTAHHPSTSSSSASAKKCATSSSGRFGGKQYRQHSTSLLPEVFLTRLLMWWVEQMKWRQNIIQKYSKGTLQRFVDAFFDAVLLTDRQPHNVPIVLKYVFDFLDAEAAHSAQVESILYPRSVKIYIFHYKKMYTLNYCNELLQNIV